MIPGDSRSGYGNASRRAARQARRQADPEEGQGQPVQPAGLRPRRLLAERREGDRRAGKEGRSGERPAARRRPGSRCSRSPPRPPGRATSSRDPTSGADGEAGAASRQRRALDSRTVPSRRTTEARGGALGSCAATRAERPVRRRAERAASAAPPAPLRAAASCGRGAAGTSAHAALARSPARRALARDRPRAAQARHRARHGARRSTSTAAT